MVIVNNAWEKITYYNDQIRKTKNDLKKNNQLNGTKKKIFNPYGLKNHEG
mgnify:CR=1 FL=1